MKCEPVAVTFLQTGSDRLVTGSCPTGLEMTLLVTGNGRKVPEETGDGTGSGVIKPEVIGW